MKRLLKLFALVILLFSFAINTEAQQKHNKKERKEMIKQLHLTKQQKRQFKAFHRSTKHEREAIKNNTALSQEQKSERLMHLRKENQEKLKSILTPEQKEKWMEMRKNEPKRGVTDMPNERTAR